MESKRDIKDFNPFPGLRPFTEEDRDLFFGRETESEEIISKLLKNKYITVIGPSGTGKSSLVSAGVLPKIRNSKFAGSSGWKIITMRPGNNPFGNLATALSLNIQDNTIRNIELNHSLTQILDSHSNFSDIVRKYNDDNILLVIDQLEDLFRYFPADTTPSDALRFIEFLVRSINKCDGNVFIIITIRSEFLGECSHYWELAKLINNSNYLVPELIQERWAEVITRPVSYAGERIDQNLVEILLSDIKNRPDKFAVLQHAMMRTYSHWQESKDNDRPINKIDYDSIGTINSAISNHANSIYESLSQRGREICASLFKTITRKGPDNKGLRHPADIKTIKSIAQCSTEELSDIFKEFSKPERSFITMHEGVRSEDNSIIDLRHECLIRLWPLLKEWIEVEAASMQIYQRLSDASALYQQGKAGLMKQPDLIAAITWRDKYKPDLAWAVQYNPAFERAMVYLRTSEKEFLEAEEIKVRVHRHKMKRVSLIMRVFGIVILLTLGLTAYSYVQKINAQKEAILSENLKIQAIKLKAIADSSANIAIVQKTLSDSAASVAAQSAREAREEKIVAYEQKANAEKTVVDALNQKKVAIEQKNGTQRLRMLSIGKAMSLKSLQLTGQKDLQALLAFQAYLFNKKNNGPENDADIYAGLYNVALQNGGINYKSFNGHKGDVKSIAFVPGKNEFFSSGNDGQILKWSLDKKDQTIQVIYAGKDIIDVLAVSPDASWLACGSSNASIRMIPLKGNASEYEMTGHKGGIKSLIFSYDGKYLYSAALDGKVLKWDIAARTNVNVSTGQMEITSLDISSKGNFLAGLSTDGNVLVWNPEKNSGNFRIETGGRKIKAIRFNPDNNILAIGDADGTVELWDIERHKKLSSVKAHDSQINDIRFNAGLRQMATAGNDKKIKIFDVSDPSDLTQPPVTLADNESFVLVMQFSPDGQIIISGESGGDNNLISRPAHVDYLVQNLCSQITRNMSQEEWNVYVGKDIPLEKTCLASNFNIKIEPLKQPNK